MLPKEGPPTKLKVAAIQLSANRDAREANIQKAMARIRDAAAQGARLCVLPELALDVFFPQWKDDTFFSNAESADGPLVQAFQTLAKELSIYIALPFFEKSKVGMYYNTVALLDSQGHVTGLYRKTISRLLKATRNTTLHRATAFRQHCRILRPSCFARHRAFSTKKTGLLGTVLTQLQNNGVACTPFDKITPNPLTTLVQHGTELAITENCDVVIELGGDSSLDAAKSIALMACNSGNVRDYIFNRKSGTRALPIIAVPTTCSTGSEGNGFAVMTDPEMMDKKSLRTNSIIPACSIVDPLLMTTMPKRLLASVGFDTLCHNIKAYLSADAQPLTNM